MAITLDGIDGEQALFEWLKKRGKKFFQPDCLVEHGDGYVLMECKRQEMFLAPPFDGHGLPRWQIQARLKFQKVTGIRCMVWIKEKPTNRILYQWLDVLEAGKHFDTNGLKPRRIYPVISFKIGT